MIYNFGRQSYKWVAFFFAVLSFSSSLAQSVGNYTVTRNTGISYSSIVSTGNSMPGWRNTGSFIEDDNRSIATNIGFDFWYNGDRYTQFSVSTNGFMDFSSSTDDGGPSPDDYGYDNSAFTNSRVANGTWLALAPFYDDMTTAGGSDPLGSSIKYQLSGTAPNRILTIEWIGMAVYQNTSPDINFQVKLYETTGVIEYNYGTMVSGTNTFNYTVGINAASVSRNPQPSELLTQQTANSANFSNSLQNNLTTMPTTNSQLVFTPLTPANPTGNLTFSAITNTGMTLNWTNWAANEIGYVIYYSTDNTNFYFYTQTAADATTTAISGLLPSTNYYYRVHAVTEGTLSNALIGNAATLAPGTITSITSGRWDRTTTWDCSCIPSAADNVVILNTHNVEYRSNGNANDLTIGGGASGSLQFTTFTARTLNINGNLVINAGGTLDVATGSNPTHTINLGGNLVNSGTLDLRPDNNSECQINFTKTDGNQTISGNGVLTRFYTINLNKGLKANILEVISTNFSCDPNALTFGSGGTFKMSSTGTNTFSLFSGTGTIPINGKIWMNSANSTMNFGGSLNLIGELTIDEGTINLGDAANENLVAAGGSVTINGGAMNIAGRFDRLNAQTVSYYLQTGGTLALPTIGSTSTTQSPFGIDVVGSSFTTTGGTIIIKREGGSGGQNLGINTSGVSLANVTGGTIQLGDATTPAGQTMLLNIGTSIGSLLVNSANATAQIVANNLTVLNDITISAGILNDNGFDITLSGNWNATGGSFVASALAKVSFIGGNQSVTSNGSAFGNLELLGTGIKSFQDNLDVNGNLLFSTTLNPVNSGFQLNLEGDFTNNGVFNNNNETIVFDGTLTQNIGGSSASTINNITINKTGGGVNFNGVFSLLKTLDVQSATAVDLDGIGSGAFTLVSSATTDARIGALEAGATLTGNMVFEKYFGGAGIKYWRHIGSAVIDATIADIQNGIPISGTFTGNDNGSQGIPVNAYPSLYYYDPSSGLASETLDDRWVIYPAANNTELLTTASTIGRGYAIWVRETGAQTFNLTGPVNSGPINFNISSANEGWNLVGNPYPSDIDWDNTGWTKTGIQGGTVYIWNGSQYLFWNGSIGSLGSGRIAKGQGFWVQATAPAVLSAAETVKTGVAATTYRLSPSEMPVLELILSSAGYNDKTYIQFDNNGLAVFDEKDATKLKNSIFNFASLSSDSIALSLNVLQGKCGFEVPLVVRDTWNGSYAISWASSSPVLNSYQIELIDRFSGDTTEITASTSQYNFVIGDDVATKSADRFVLRFSAKTLNNELTITSEQRCETEQAELYIENTQINVLYNIYHNEKLLQSFVGGGYDMIIALDSGLNIGENLLHIQAQMPDCNTAIREYVHSLTLIAKPELVYNADTNVLRSGNGSVGFWYLNNEIISPIPTSSIEPDLSEQGIYTFAVTNGNCTLVSDEFLVTSVDDERITAELEIWPNPVIDFINIQYPIPREGKVLLRIQDVAGKLYYSLEDIPESININDYESGIYILTITTDLEQVSLRFIKL